MASLVFPQTLGPSSQFHSACALSGPRALDAGAIAGAIPTTQPWASLSTTQPWASLFVKLHWSVL